jgi:multimeric flavodoxin WrbA
MKLIAINGSPRKSWNTATLLKRTIEGAQAAGAKTELIHLYDLTFKGCTSCFACKMIDSPNKGHCAMKDGLTPVLKMIEDQADAVVLGTPVYFGSMSGELKSCTERLLFAPLVYSQPPRSLFPRKLRTANNLYDERFRGNEQAARLPGNDERYRSIIKDGVRRGRDIVLL